MIAFQRLHPRSLAAITIVAAVCGAGSAHPVWGQGWQTSGSSVYVTGGNVGIGTTSPGQAVTIDGGGQILEVRSGGYPMLRPTANNWDMRLQSVGTRLDILSGGSLGLPVATFTHGGNVGIGTTAPQHKLSVNGTIGAREVIVTNSGWPDHVFRPGYRLMPLPEVAKYIRRHGHLPEIPSEAKVQEKGIGIGEMQAKLLAKIEELTLHMIQIERQNRQLQERIARLEAGSTSKAGASQGAARND